jgi:hypothetical protein
LKRTEEPVLIQAFMLASTRPLNYAVMIMEPGYAWMRNDLRVRMASRLHLGIHALRKLKMLLQCRQRSCRKRFDADVGSSFRLS